MKIIIRKIMKISKIFYYVFPATLGNSLCPALGEHTRGENFRRDAIDKDFL